MKKRIISMALIVTLIFTVLGVGPFSANNNVVKAEEYRNGFSLKPQLQDVTGIDTKTTFLFKSVADESLKSLQEGLKVYPEVKFTIAKKEEGYFIIPSSELETNKLYTFTYKDATWTFQTMATFRILGTLPNNEAIRVPLASGIELYFSHSSAQVKDYFEIQPSVQGVFEEHGSTVVFVPKGLKEKTLYTVTLKSGLSLTSSNQKLTEDYSFTFETASKEDEAYKEPKGYFNFNSIMSEYALNEAPKIPMSYYIDGDFLDTKIKTTLYAYPSIDNFMDAIIDYNELPHWSMYSLENNKVKTDGLSKSISFEQPVVQNQNNQQFLNIPEKLPAGYYLVDSTWEDLHFQTLIQVTNLSYYYSDASNKGILWINDLATGKSVQGAVVTQKGSEKKYTSNVNGVVELPTSEAEAGLTLYKMGYGNQSALVMNYPYNTYYWNDSLSQYWKYLQTDRNLYQPDDKVMVWGFLQNRYEDEDLKEVTIEVNSSNWRMYDMWGRYGNDIPYTSKKVAVKNGFYEGDIELPNLEPGNYQIEVKLKDKVVSSTYLQVEKYIKPEYKIEANPDKKAVFVGDSVHFITKTSFFEGTPVAKLNVNYNISGLDYKTGEMKTDTKGLSKIAYTPQYKEEYQGMNYIYFNAYASLPESGQIDTSSALKVFMNDINVKFTTTLDKDQGTINAEVNKIVLDKLNDNIEDNDEEFLGDAISAHLIKGTVYKNEWKKKEIGEYYDFINKVVVKQYDYYTEKVKVQDITLVTDKVGKAVAKVTLPSKENSYYTVELKTNDLSGKKMTFEQYYGEHWMYSPSYERYILKSEKATFDLGDTIDVQFMNNDKALPAGNFLYITAQNGIKKYEVKQTSKYTTTFDETFIPNADLIGVYFNGKTYIQGEHFSPRLDLEKNRISFTAETDKDSYKPGEICTVKLKATIFSKALNKEVGAKGVTINISIVDEALFQLSDQSIDTLESLYEWVPNGIKNSYSSHKNDGYNMIMPMMYGRGGLELESAQAMPTTANSSKDAKDEAQVGAVRSEFKDTAYFTSIHLDENGVGTFSYKLPDNVTSWRMTFAGISETLKAGTNVEEVIVTMPYFINTSLSSIYLEGDKPFVGITAYGSNLKNGEKITYEVSCKENGYKSTVKGTAFERSNVPLFDMKEGDYNLIIKATSASGYTDAIEKQIKVVKTYHEKEVADFYQLTDGFKLTTTNEGMTRLTFVDKGKGQFIPSLYSLAYSGGKRVDQKYIGLLARNILLETFGEEILFKEEVALSDYQMEDGGFGILPYAASDLETTVKLLPVIKSLINDKAVTSYLYNALNDKKNTNSRKAIALYGLAVMNEPVVIELEKLEKNTNLNLKDYIYLSLTYAALGDHFKANEIYSKHIVTNIEKYDQVARIKTGKTEDEYLEYTALTMLIASALDLEEKQLFFDYVKSQNSKEVLVNSEILTFIKNEIGKVKESKLSVTYSYDGKSYTKKVEDGWPVTITLPSSKLKDFKVTKVEGSAGLVAIYNAKLSKTTTNDNNMKASRTYYNYYTKASSKEFAQSDIVKVQIDWSIAKSAIDDTYIVTDYLPSGLRPIENVWDMGLKTGDDYWYRDIDGQKVTFYISKNYDKYESLYYYARVVTPGNYKAEGVVVQGVNVKDSIYIGVMDNIKVKE
ncbi:MAG: alpha-2-macroglobulin [Firmicutes bacterium HGW-Firmicutes-1]|jgi:hypothetical protein|nr:MAG: alpha-2-macroglobulin [Firmicutes bacterium HGW-Firmicutes-1]